MSFNGIFRVDFIALGSLYEWSVSLDWIFFCRRRLTAYLVFFYSFRKSLRFTGEGIYWFGVGSTMEKNVCAKRDIDGVSVSIDGEKGGFSLDVILR